MIETREKDEDVLLLDKVFSLRVFISATLLMFKSALLLKAVLSRENCVLSRRVHFRDMVGGILCRATEAVELKKGVA